MADNIYYKIPQEPPETFFCDGTDAAVTYCGFLRSIDRKNPDFRALLEPDGTWTGVETRLVSAPVSHYTGAAYRIVPV
jgi:hypothetical protein